MMENFVIFVIGVVVGGLVVGGVVWILAGHKVIAHSLVIW